MNFTIEVFHSEKLTLDLPSKIGFSIFIFFILGFGISVQKQLITFLRYMKNRPVNQIIYKNLVLQNLFYPLLLVYSLFDIWDNKPGHLIGELGCVFCMYAGLFIVNHDRAHSLFINLFRYICIVKEESMRESQILPKVSKVNFLLWHTSTKLKIPWTASIPIHNKLLLVPKISYIFSKIWIFQCWVSLYGNSCPQVVAWSIIVAQIIVSLICSLSTTYMMSFVPFCMGRTEVYYSYDYFYIGGYSLRNEFCNYDNMFYYLLCILMQIIQWLIYSNIIDIMLLINIAFVLKSYRNSAQNQNLLTSSALLQRKR